MYVFKNDYFIWFLHIFLEENSI